MEWTDDVFSAAEELAGVFEALGVRYLLGGSMAAAVWGEPRFTRDVDMVAALRSEHVAPFVAALGERGYADESMIGDAMERRSSFNVIRNKRMVKVDIFVPPSDGLHAAKWSRARSIRLGPASIRTVATTSAEHALLQKLVRFRDGGEFSELQWRDVVVLARMLVGELDWPYVESWAEQLGLVPLLERARKDVTV